MVPDGKWIAIVGDEGNTFRLYARPYPGPGESIPVTGGSARYARWRGDGRELYFLSESEGDKTIMAVDVTWSGGVPDFGPARALVKIPGIVMSNFAFDVTKDGQRFVAVVTGDPDPSPLTMVMATALEAGRTC